MNNGGGNVLKSKTWADTAKLTNMRTAEFGKSESGLGQRK